MPSLFLALAFSFLIPLATAQWLDSKLLGSCADVSCPQADDTTIEAACRIADQTYGGVGVDTFPFNASSPGRWAGKNLTWTVAYHDYTNYDPDENLERTIEKAFFLGTSLDLRTAIGFGGCAVVMEAYDKLLPSQGSTSSKKCEDVIGAECHRELQDDMMRFAKAQGESRFNNSSDACDGFKEYLQSVSGDDSKCDMDWTQVHYVRKFLKLPLQTVMDVWLTRSAFEALIGDAAPKPLSREQNASTNCYPTEPKTNDLAFVLNWNNTGTMYANDTVKMISSINLALTAFWNSAGKPDENPEAHVSCLWPVDETTRSRQTKSSGEGEGEGGAAGRVESVVWSVLGTVLVAAWGLM